MSAAFLSAVSQSAVSQSARPAYRPAVLRAAPLILAALALTLAGCGGRGKGMPQIRFAQLSPSGEILGPPTPDRAVFRDTLGAWFARTDTNGDGNIDAAEMAADADRSFALFDADRDGSITAADMTAYRVASPHRPPSDRPSSRLVPRNVTIGADQLEAPPTGERSRRPRLRTAFDPVMSADADADFRVTPAELRAQSQRRAVGYDRNGDGRVERAEFVEAQLALVAALRPDLD